ncbi:MAG: pilus assembly FimT family protein [Sarcina sp.]
MLKNKLKNKKKGFTLIELIVVLAVLAIIALIAIPNFNQIRENSKVTSDKRGADLIDKSVTILVQDDSIKKEGVDDKGNQIAGTGTKVGLYRYNDTKEGLIFENATGTNTFTTAEKEIITKTLNDGKGPQSYEGNAVWRVEITQLGTSTPDVRVKLFEDKTKADAAAVGAGNGLYDSNVAEKK